MKLFSYKKIISFFFMFSVLINQAVGQTRISRFDGYLMAGWQKLDVKDLNTILQQHNYPVLDENYESLGGGGYGIVNNFVICGEGHGLIRSEVSNANYRLNLSAGYGIFNVGYVIYHNFGLRIFPLIGFGAGGIDLTIYEKPSPDFDDIMNNPKRGSSLSLGGLMFNFGLSGSYNMANVFAGYTQFLKLDNWTFFEKEISCGPNIGISGFYLRFSIGGGGSGKYSERK